jgi:hypothetical protein
MLVVMRKAGFTLLLAGFLYLVLYAFGMSSVKAALVAVSAQGQLPQKESFSIQEVERYRLGTALRMRVRVHMVAIPAALMLCGGILLDRASRRPQRPVDEA